MRFMIRRVLCIIGFFSSSGLVLAQSAPLVPSAIGLDSPVNKQSPIVTTPPPMDFSWANGNDRRDSSVFHNAYFTPTILVDANTTHSFNNPIDHTVVGSTALAHDDEMEVSAVNIGGDFTNGNARGRIMTQFGTRAMIVSQGDESVYRGQYNLGGAYRYLSEAYGGYHFDKLAGINIDAGLFMSYVGLNSYYQAENWEYQASFTSDNTPWYFNGVRAQFFITTKLKVELWLINGWQSYGMFNALPGFGGNITYTPTENIKMLTNDYYGTDDAGLLGRHRFHSDNSFLMRYLQRSKQSKGVNQMAFCATVDVGNDKGDGADGFSSANGQADYFLSCMAYNRIWFAKKKWAWCIGGGWMTNPGRYLVLPPPGDASPLPNPLNPTQTIGTHPFSMNPGDQFTAWDCSTNISWMPNQSIEFRLEGVYRHANVDYFAGPGGVTSPTGYSTTPLPSNWMPDLVKSETRIILAVLFRL